MRYMHDGNCLPSSVRNNNLTNRTNNFLIGQRDCYFLFLHFLRQIYTAQIQWVYTRSLPQTWFIGKGLSARTDAPMLFVTFVWTTQFKSIHYNSIHRVLFIQYLRAVSIALYRTFIILKTTSSTCRAYHSQTLMVELTVHKMV